MHITHWNVDAVHGQFWGRNAFSDFPSLKLH